MRNISLLRVIFLSPFVLCGGAEVQAQQLVTRADATALRADPGGPLRGQISRAVPVVDGERRGEWVEVTVSGWIRVTDLVEAGGTSSSNGVGESGGIFKQQISAAPVELVDFDLKAGNRDLKGVAGVMALTLKVRNTSSTAKVSGWTGTLSVQSSSGQNLFRYRINHGDANLEPGAEGEVSFYWQKGDKEYELLSSLTKADIKVAIQKLELIKG